MSELHVESIEQPLRRTPVVTCFLMKLEEREQHILLVRRSPRVGSYNARWAGVSGFIEQGVTPDEQAYTEIREETGLQRDQVCMLKRGTVVEYGDSSINRHWLVHPYLFQILVPDAIKLDWEAEDMRWILPSELQNYETVPRLHEAFLSASNGETVEP